MDMATGHFADVVKCFLGVIEDFLNTGGSPRGDLANQSPHEQARLKPLA
jgi:hypothetical protein